MRARKSSVVLLAAAALLVPLVVACGTPTTADPASTAASQVSSAIAAPTAPSSEAGPTVTVPGLGSSTTPSPSSAPAPSSVTPPATPKPPTKPAKSTPKPPPSSETVDITTTVTVPPSTTRTQSSSQRSTTQQSTPDQPTTTPKADPPATTKNQGGGGAGGTMTRKVVVIDPGHNGQNNAHPEILKQQVPAGFGEMKDCNTTGTETNDGYTESLFNWKTALRLKEKLQAKGITVIMTRDSNDGVGPCVNERAAVGNDNKADAVISIHGDGDTHESVHGFYVMTAERAPAGDAMAAESHRLAKDVRDGLVGDGSTPSNSLGQDGLWQRSDLSGLNLSMRPTVMVEMGNMRSSGDAAAMSSADGQDKFAAGLAAGVVAFLVHGG